MAAIVLLAALVGCGRQPVDAKLVGSWQTAIASPNGPYQVRFTTASNGAYRIDSGARAVGEAETGAFSAAGGKWRREKLTGGSNEGTYEFLSADTVLFKSKTDAVLWSRIPNDAPAATSPPAAAGSPAPVGFAGSDGPAASVTEPSAALLAAGPFGAPLPPAPAAVVPQSFATESAFGAAAPATALPQAVGANAQPPAGGANGPPSAGPPATPSPAADQPPSYVQHARQAKAQAKSSASEATTAVKEAGDEAEKRIGPFRKAGSKIKNFFTGHKDDDAGSSSTQQDNH